MNDNKAENLASSLLHGNKGVVEKGTVYYREISLLHAK